MLQCPSRKSSLLMSLPMLRGTTTCFFFFLTYTEGQYNTKVHSSIHIQTWITIFFSLVLTSSFYLHPWVTFINDETGEYLFYLVIFKGNISRSPVHHQAGETCLSGALGHYWSREPSDPDSLPYYWVYMSWHHRPTSAQCARTIQGR